MVKKDESMFKIDATSIDFPDNHFDSVICMSALEHIENFDEVFNEIHRVLKPKGQFLLNTPWLFPFHGAPDDYFRFSSTALKNRLSSNFQIKEFKAVGNFWLSQAVFLQRPEWSRIVQNKKTKPYDFILRLIGIIFMIIGSSASKTDPDDNYSLLYCILCENN